MTWWEILRPFFWGGLWWTVTGWTLDALWPDLSLWIWYPAVIVACFVANCMAREQSLRWRWLMVRHRERLERPMVYNEDGQLLSAVLPGERVCVLRDAKGPITAHVHSRTLILGRHRMRAETRWREDPR